MLLRAQIFKSHCIDLFLFLFLYHLSRSPITNICYNHFLNTYFLSCYCLLQSKMLVLNFKF